MTLTPKSEAELAQMIQDSNGPLALRGAGTRQHLLRTDTTPLALTELSGISLYEPGALTLVARAGTTITDINRTLAAENQQLAFEPMDMRPLLDANGGEPTIGGVVATNNSGPRRVAVGACRDFLLGVRFVDGAGRILKNGGRVMKNVTGYDLVKLLAGSWGTLGALSEVSLKVLPIPETSATLVWRNLNWDQSAALFVSAMSSPFEVTGAARVPASTNSDDESLTYLRLEGFENSVRYRTERLCALSGHTAPDHVETDANENLKLWQDIRDIRCFAGRAGNVWRSAIKPTDMPQILAQSDLEHAIDWGGGLIWTLAPPEVDLRRSFTPFQGHSTLIRGQGFPVFPPLAAPLAALSKGVRNQFDPRSILNPGLMG